MGRCKTASSHICDVIETKEILRVYLNIPNKINKFQMRTPIILAWFLYQINFRHLKAFSNHFNISILT